MTDTFKLHFEYIDVGDLRFLDGEGKPKESLCPDGKDWGMASFEGSLGSAEVTWRVESKAGGLGDDLVVLEPQGDLGHCCKVTAKKRPGRAYLIAKATLPDGGCEFERKIPIVIGCKNCANGDCSSAGGGSAENGCIEVSIGVGRLPGGGSAGHFDIYSDEPDDALATPEGLHFHFACDDVEVIRDLDIAGGETTPSPILQVKTALVLADVDVDSTSAYEIRLYDVAGAVLARPVDGGPFIVPSSDPFATWRIEKDTNAQGPFRLMVTKYVDGTSQTGTFDRMYDYTHTGTASAGTWTLATRATSNVNDSVQSESHVWSGTQSPWTVTRTINRDDGVYSVHIDTVTQFSWGKAVTKTVVDVTGDGVTSDDLVTEFQYYDAGANNETIGRLKLQLNPDASWTYYTYDAQGRTTLELSSWLDDSLPLTPTADDGHAFIYTYTDDRLTSVVEKILGTEVGKTEYVYTTEGSPAKPKTITKRYPSPSGTPLQTATVYEDDTEALVTKITHEDGRVDHYQYADGDWNGTTFTVNQTTGKAHRTIVEHFNDQGSAESGKTTKDVSIVDKYGNAVRDEMHVSTGGTGYALVTWTNRAYDALGRLTDIYRSDGTYEQHDPQDCCYSNEVTDTTGLTTVSVYDLLGRPTLRTQELGAGTGDDIITTYAYGYDAADMRVETVTTTAGSGPSQVTTQTKRVYDLAGRLIESWENPNVENEELVTFYEYGESTVGGDMVTVTHPSGAEEVTEHYVGGAIYKRSGSAVVTQTYEYGRASGERWTEVTTGDEEDRYVKTTTDMLGRVTKEERPAFGGGTLATTYSYEPTDGRLVSIANPGQATTLYAYDAMGDVWRTALDLDADSTIDLSGSGTIDRVTETETAYVTYSSQIWREAVSKIYADNTGTPIVVGKSRTRLTGFTYSGNNVTAESQSEDARGVNNTTTVTTTTNRGSRTVTVVTDRPDTSTNPQTVTVNGLLQSAADAAGVTTSFGYDALGRRTTVTDGRNNVTTTHYDACGRVDWVKDDDQNQTAHAYYSPTQTAAGQIPGRLKAVTNPGGKVTRYAYTDRGEIAYVWGDVPQPTFIEYDEFGQRTKLHTHRGGDDWGGEEWPEINDDDVTEWTYDPATGLMTRKTYADATHVDYDYTSVGRLETRTWARTVNSQALITTYAYDSGTGEMTGIDYSDSTPDATFTYNRAGRMASVTDVTGQRTFAYDPATLEPIGENLPDGYFSANRDLVRAYSGPVGRMSGLGIDTNGDGTIDSEYNVGYAYSSTNGCMSRVTGPGLPWTGNDHGVFYSYYANTNLVEKTEYRDSSGSNVARTTRGFEANRDLIATVQNDWLVGGTTNVSTYNYDNDTRGRRTEVIRTGSAFATGHKDVWEYNDRNELTDSTRYNDTTEQGTADHDGTYDYGYTYDPIGNRKTYTYKPATETSARTATYQRNALNQYGQASVSGGAYLANRLVYDADGNLSGSLVVADMNCDGSVNPFDIECFNDAMVSQAEYDQNCPNCDWHNADVNGDGSVNAFDINGFLAALSNDPDVAPDTVGVLHRKYSWDAENRLIREEPKVANPGEDDTKSEYAYDYMSRRVEKKVWTRLSGNWQLTLHRRFVYDGWNLLLELDAANSNAILRKYSWGLDLAGQNGSLNSLQGAGGIGGLLACYDTNGGTSTTTDDRTFAYFYDANGNVGQLVETTSGTNHGDIAASYEYDPYGGRSDDGSGDTIDQPFRFSTKYFDAEAGFYYYGFRYYASRLGRWLGRDPLSELAGSQYHQLLGAAHSDDTHLYLFSDNSPTMTIDALGLTSYSTLGPVFRVMLENEIYNNPSVMSSFGAKITHFDDCTPAASAFIQASANTACDRIRHAFRITSSDRLWNEGIRKCATKRPFSLYNLSGSDWNNLDRYRTDLAFVLFAMARGCTYGIGIECECCCDRETYAYVPRPLGFNNWSDLHICQLFYTQKPLDRVSTIVHELSHLLGERRDEYPPADQFSFGAYHIELAVEGLNDCNIN